MIQEQQPPATKFCLPDFVSQCPTPVRLNRHHKQACAEGDKWFIRGAELTGRRKDVFVGHRATLMAARCYPLAAYPQIRVLCDCMTWLFSLDDISDEMSSLGMSRVAADVMNVLWHPGHYQPRSQIARMCKDFWKRLIRTASPVAQQRFKETLDMYFQAAAQQAVDHETSTIPDPDTYMALRRDTSGLRVTWTLIEYAYNLAIPDEVMEHAAIRDIADTVNDIVTFSNDLYSWNVEQSRGDSHNLVSVLMQHRGLDIQSAADEVGDIVNERMKRFFRQRADIPSWGPEIDKQVSIYTTGLEYWIPGSFVWSLETERYFGKVHKEVQKTRIVSILPPRTQIVLHTS